MPAAVLQVIERANNNVYGLASGIIRCGLSADHLPRVTCTWMREQLKQQQRLRPGVRHHQVRRWLSLLSGFD